MLQTIKQVSSIARDLMIAPAPDEILSGDKMLRPFLKNQNRWIQYFHPQTILKNNQDPWILLQKYVMPLIRQFGSSYHIDGIKLLGLDSYSMPNFEIFRSRFFEISNGFDLEPVADEIEPKQYFSLILDKKFPCVQKLRPINEVFCGNEPDFWHEAIGHIAPLCFQPVQAFYGKIANFMLSAKSDAEFNDHLAVAWTLTEYAFLKEYGQHKMFGAALIGSHLAHMRHLNGNLSLETADRKNIIESGFFAENTPIPRDNQGKLRFFYLDSLNVERLFMQC